MASITLYDKIKTLNWMKDVGVIFYKLAFRLANNGGGMVEDVYPRKKIM